MVFYAQSVITVISERERQRETETERDGDRQTDRQIQDFNVQSTALGHLRTKRER